MAVHPLGREIRHQVDFRGHDRLAQVFFGGLGGAGVRGAGQERGGAGGHAPKLPCAPLILAPSGMGG